MGKKYGILHYLHIIFSCREFWLKRIKEVPDGHLVKFDGDNVIARFGSIEDAMKCAWHVYKDIAAFTATREKDWHIRMGIGMAFGDFSLLGSEIAGETFEHSFFMGEDHARTGEILMTQRVKEALPE